ncbi:hypothetical protein GCM10010214_03130 [Streptomyces abikoensis]|nr:hypothetical protein GCM10010214_03130 [Streptomyces abikoensis]
MAVVTGGRGACSRLGPLRGVSTVVGMYGGVRDPDHELGADVLPFVPCLTITRHDPTPTRKLQ